MKWLLRAYPADYRRERGQEIVQTFLDAGRGRLSPREAINLVCHGMRARLGRPASRWVVRWAALFSIVCGLFAAAAATRLAWETARPLPSEAEAAQVFETMLPGKGWAERIDRSPAMFVIYGEPLSLTNFENLFFGDGGEYEFGRTQSYVEDGPDPVGPALATARENLRANGWTVQKTIVSDAVVCARCDPSTLPQNHRVIAHKGDTLLELEFSERSGFRATTHVSVELQRRTPWAAYPAGAVAGLLGALGGWLIFGWAARRSGQTHSLVRILANTFFGIMLFLWGVWIPPSVLYMVDHQMLEPHPRWHPLWEWLGQPVSSFPFVVGFAAGLLALALAALPRRQRVKVEVGAA